MKHLQFTCFRWDRATALFHFREHTVEISVRSRAESLAPVVNWGMNFVIFFTFLTLVSAIARAGTFWLYAALGIAAIVFACARVPETRGRSLEQIQQQLSVGAAK